MTGSATMLGRDPAVAPKNVFATHEIDVTAQARALAMLRLSDPVLVLLCGAMGVAVISDLDFELGPLILIALSGVAVCVGWFNLGVIDERVWRAHVWLLPLLGVLFAVAASVMVGDVVKEPKASAVLSVAVLAWSAAVSFASLVAIRVLRRRRIGATRLLISDLLCDLRGARNRIPRGGARPKVSRVMLGCGLCVLAFAPLLARSWMTWGRTTATLLVEYHFAAFLIVRARRYFQVDARSLLSTDRRAPVLFLRSFNDDERHRYAQTQRAMLDFSLETRLTNHLLHFGPFVAVGSPDEAVPQPGAARVRLSDDQWQRQVLAWMQQASLIVMYVGRTTWVNWELGRVLDSGRQHSLILLFPEVRHFSPWSRKHDFLSRMEELRQAFKGTAWEEEIAACDGVGDWQALVLRRDGSLLVVKSRSRSRDSHHIAALVAHHSLLSGSLLDAAPPGPRKSSAAT